MGRNPVGAKYNVSNLTRGLDVVELLVQHHEGLGVTEIAQALKIPKNAAFRITAALCERGYLLRNDGAKSFTLSPLLMTLGYRAANQTGLAERAMPLMRELRDAVKETVLLSTVAGTEGVVLDHVPGLYPFHFTVDPGSTFPLHAAAPGKALLAFLPPPVRDGIIERLELVRYNERTITTKQALLQELAKIRECGYALDRAEQFDGVHCAGAALLDGRGHAVAAINVTGPMSRFTEAMLDTVGRQTSECAQRISQLLGFAGGNGHRLG